MRSVLSAREPKGYISLPGALGFELCDFQVDVQNYAVRNLPQQVMQAAAAATAPPDSADFGAGLYR